METSGKLVSIFAVLVILSALSFSTTTFDCPGCTSSHILLTYDKDSGVAEVIVAGFNQTYEKEVKDFLDNWLDPDVGEDLVHTSANAGNIATLENVPVYLSYYNKSSAQTMYVDCDPNEDGVNPVYTTESKTMTNEEGEVALIHYGECTIPAQTYHEQCIIVHGEFEGYEEIGSSKTIHGVAICDTEGVSIFSKITTSLVTAITLVADQNPGVCVLSFLLIGVLFASMFYSGRSPLSLLDLTTPKLPSPKSLAVSGSIKAPMSYGRMKSGIRETSKALDKLFKAYAGAGALAGLAGSPLYLRALAKWVGSNSPGDLAAVNACYSGGRVDMRALRRVLNSLKEHGPEGKNFATMIELRIMGDEQLHHMNIFSGGTERGEVSAAQRAAGWVMNGAGKVPLVGSFLGTSLGNLFSGYQFTKRIARSMGSSALVALTPGRAATSARRRAGERLGDWRERTRDWRTRGGKGGRALKWLPGKFGEAFLAAGSGLALSSDEAYIDIGRVFRVDHKMAQHYSTLLKEAHNDVDIYIMQRLFRSVGVDQELVGTTTVLQSRPDHKMAARLLALARLIDAESADPARIARLAQLEGRIVQRALSLEQREGESYSDFRLRRTRALLRLVSEYGATLDMAGVNSALSSLTGIDGSGLSEEARWVRLTTYLNRVNGTDPAEGSFYHLTGREEVWYDHGTDIVSRNLFKTFMDNVGEGNFHLSNNAGESMLVNSMKGNFAKMVNEFCGIQVADHLSDPELKQLMRVTYGYLDELVADRTALGRFGGPTNDPTSLFFDAELHQRAKDEKIAFVDEHEHGPQEGWWKLNMKWFWLHGEQGAELPEAMHQTTVRDHVDGMFDRAYSEEHIARFEGRAASLGLNREQKRDLYVLGYMMDRLKLRLNEDSHNSFGTGYENVRTQYNTIYAEFIRRYAKYATDANGNRRYSQATSDHLENLSADEVVDEVVLRRSLAGRDSSHFLTDMRDNFLDKPVTYDIHRKGAWARMNEGGYVAVNEEVPLSSMDIVLNGVVAYRDVNGTLREFKPKDINIHSELAESGMEGRRIQRMMETVGGDRDSWDPVFNATEQAVRNGRLSGSTLVSLAYNYAQTTHDWTRLQALRDPGSGRKMVSLISRDEFLQQKSREGSPLAFLSRAKWKFGYAVERNLMNSFGANARALDAVNQISTVYRTRYHQLSADIFSGRGVDSRYRAMYEDIAKRQAKYEFSWAFTVDRHPSGSSTAQGEMLWMESFYHHGPKMASDPNQAHMPYYSTPQRAAMRINNLFINLGRRVMMGPVSSFRTFKVASEGRPTKYEHTGDPMDRWRMRQPSKLEAVRSLVNPAYAGWEFQRTRRATRAALSGVSRGVDYMIPDNWATSGSGIKRFVSRIPERMVPSRDWTLGGEGLRRKMHGPSSGPDAGKATMPTKEDFALARENVAVTAIHGNANPASSYLDSTRTMRYDVSTSEQLVYRPDIHGFYADDTELRAQARSNVVKREASALLHTVHRNREIHSHGGIGGHGFWGRMTAIAPVAIGSYRVGKWILGGGPQQRWQAHKQRKAGRERARAAGYAPSRSQAARSWVSRYAGSMAVHTCLNCGMQKRRGGRCPGCGR